VGSTSARVVIADTHYYTVAHTNCDDHTYTIAYTNCDDHTDADQHAEANHNAHADGDSNADALTDRRIEIGEWQDRNPLQRFDSDQRRQGAV
jgi:hypothetical protein